MNKTKYRIYLFFFFLLVLTIAFILINFIFSKAVIRVDISSYEVKASDDFVVDFSGKEQGADLKKELLKLKEILYKNDENSKKIKGEVEELDLKISKELEVPGEGVVVADRARGMVKIFNNGSSPQTLVRTTRLLTSDNKLFRIDKTVYIPPNSFIEVSAYADKKGEEGNIKKGTKFTIPGLPKYKQKIVYAESITDFKGGTKKVKKVTREKLEELKDEFLEYMKEVGLEKFQKLGLNITLQHIFVEPKKITFNVNEGDEAEKVRFSGEARVKALIFDIDKIKEYLSLKLENSLNDKEKLLKIEDSTFRYTIKINKDARKAQVSAEIKGIAILDENNFFSKEKLVGKSKEEIVSYIIKHPSVKRVRVSFFPPWIKKAPLFISNIKFEIKRIENNI